MYVGMYVSKYGVEGRGEKGGTRTPTAYCVLRD